MTTFYELARDETRDKNEKQLKKWRNPKNKAVRNFVKVVGDKLLLETTREDTLQFRDWWLDKIIEGGLTANAANKDIQALSRMFREVSDKYRLGLSNPFERLRLPKRRFHAMFQAC